MYKYLKFEETMTGKTLVKIENHNDMELVFTTSEGERYQLWHCQDCCESVMIEDICGNLDDLIGEPLLLAEEVSSEETPSDISKGWQDSFTWTFYRMRTKKGFVTIRWYGESNGYYSESVDFCKLT